MPGGNRVGLDGLDDLVGQAEQPNTLSDRHPVLPQALAERLLGQAEVAQQPLNRARLLDGVQVGSLQVLDQGQLEALLEAAAATRMDDDRHLGKPGNLGSPQASFAGDQLETGQAFTNQQRLQDPVHPDGVGQLLQADGIEGAPRLLRVGLDLGDRELQREAPPRPALGAQLFDVLTRRNQGLEAPSQSAAFIHLAINSFVSSW